MHVSSVQLLWVLWVGALGLFGARLCGWMPDPPDQAQAAATQLRKKTNAKNKSNTTTTNNNNHNVPTTPGAATTSTAGHHQQDSDEAPKIAKKSVAAIHKNSLPTNDQHPDGDDDDDDDDAWSCPVSRSSSEVLYRHTPVVVFAQQRTGSNLLFDMLGRLGHYSSLSPFGGDVDSKDDDVAVLPLFELLVADAMGFRRIADAVMSGKDSACDAGDGFRDDTARKEWLAQLRATAQPFAALSTIMQNNNVTLATGWQKELYRVLENALSNPGSLFRFLNGIPSRSRNAFFACKIFKDQLDTLQGVATEELVRSIVSLPRGGASGRPPKFIVLWRRNLLESYVSLLVAQRYGTWVWQDTDDRQTVQIDRQKFLDYIETQQSYYATVRDALRANNVTDFAVLEYDRDLAGRSSRVETMKRILVDLLELSPSDDGSAAQKMAETLVDQISRTKQAQVPVAKQVLNWEEVTKEWGYTGEAEDFEDIFAIRR